ncbi:MAG: COG4280 domain-containing protein [Acidimicrobiales bacterium]
MIAVTVSSSMVVLVGAVFLATAVEMVEALTIVLAVGHTRGWRSALEGTVVAFASLAALVALLGPALVHVPLSALRLIVGGVLLIFGLQWLRKAILRAGGLKELHDEDAIYREVVAEMESAGASPTRDRVAFVMAFKGVFLEGLEVVVAVLTLGTSAHRLGLAVLVAVVAVLVVAGAGAVVARQLSTVPENLMKMGVGILLVSYGTFWTGEGLHVRWPAGDVTLVAFVGLYVVVTSTLVVMVRRGVAGPRRRAVAQ